MGGKSTKKSLPELSASPVSGVCEHDNPFSAFCGTWDEGQFEEFQKATQRMVSPDDWK